MPKKPYPPEFKAQVLSKVRNRGTRKLCDIAEEVNIPLSTLKTWLARQEKSIVLPNDGSASHWTPEQRLLALHKSHALKGEERHAWCRENGLFEHQLQQWQRDFCAVIKPSRQESVELKSLQRNNLQLQKELIRKDKALAEAAALLILQKKFRALWEDEEK